MLCETMENLATNTILIIIFLIHMKEGKEIGMAIANHLHFSNVAEQFTVKKYLEGLC